MRWLVEVTSLGETEKDSLHVDADSWQKALQAARAARGETGPMSGFSIELLDEGCRAVDPTSRKRYEVRRAPDDAALGPRRASVRPQAPQAPQALQALHAPHAPQAPQAPHPPQAPHAPQAPQAAPAVPRPASQFPPLAPRKHPAVGTQTMMMGSAPGAVVESSPPAVPRADVTANMPSQIVFKREQDATEAVPLTYREYIYVVPPGSSESAAETLLRTQLDLVRSSLERMPVGKLVNLAVFDVAFHGKPTVPPLATLMWKDWRGTAAVSFPRGAPMPARPSAPPPAYVPQVAPVPQPPLPSAIPAFAQPSVPAAPAVPTEFFAPPQSGHAPAVGQVYPAVGMPPPAPIYMPAPVAVQPPLALSVPVAVPQPAVMAMPAPAAMPAPVVMPVPVAMPVPAAMPVSAPPAASIFGPGTLVGRMPSRPSETRGRVYGEELIADLFEAMHDLHFARDAVEGGDFCLTLAMEKLPSLAGIVHLYDIDRREFLVTSTRGAGTDKLLLQRHPESDPLLSAAMRHLRAMVIPDASQSEAATTGRYAIIGGVTSLVVAPVMLSGRFLGAIELLNPADGQPFTESDGNAVTYIAQQFAEFVATRGIVTDPARISARPLPDA